MANKSLLILGNGSNLHFGLPTTWVDYWHYRRKQLIFRSGVLIDVALKNKLYDAFKFDSSIKNGFMDGDFSQKLSKTKQYIDLEKRIIMSIEYLSNENLIEGFIFLDSKNKLFDRLLAGLSFVRALNLIDATWDSWSDIEHIIDLSYCRSISKNDSFNYCESIYLYLEESISDLAKYLLNVIIRTISSSIDLKDSNRITYSEIKPHYESFEKHFKEYFVNSDAINSFYKDTSKNIDYSYFIRELISLDIFVDNSFDILDFNYEPLYKMLTFDSLVSRVDTIFQPHGNIDTQLIIGGNNHFDSVKSSISSKKNRSQDNCVKYDRDSSTNKFIKSKCTYSLDMSDYDCVIIYGWSINDVDFELFSKNKLEDSSVKSLIFGYSGDFIPKHLLYKIKCFSEKVNIKYIKHLFEVKGV